MTPFPATFHIQDIVTNGAVIDVRVGGHGPAVVLLHGYGDTGDMWAPMAVDLERDYKMSLICVGSACRQSPPAASTRRPRRATLPA